jgi:hypothetical protein
LRSFARIVLVRIARVAGIATAIGMGGVAGWATSCAWAAEGATTPDEVILEVAASDARESDALAQVARELLGRLSVEVRASFVARIDLAAVVAPPRAPGGAAAPLARVWIDWRIPGRATLYLLDARRDRVLVRQVERPAGGDELAREELGHILETACEGLLAGGEVGVPRAGVVPLLMPPPAPAPVTVAAAPEDAPARVQLALLYEAATLAPGARVTHGPEASAFLGWGARASRWGLWTTAQLRFPVHAGDEQGAGVDLETGALRLLLAREQPLSARVTGRAGVGVGVDVVHARPEVTMPENAVAGPAFTREFTVGRAAVALDLRLSRRTWLVAMLAADVDVTGQRYVFSRGASEDVVLRPWSVRPAAALGLAFP